MGMLYAMLGDELCDKVLKDDVEGVTHLIVEGFDFNASCHHYGTPLQAAAAKGNEKMVYVMMKFLHADPDIKAGKYCLPLVAAICEGHEDVVETLLRYGASPLARAGSYVSPIYQAVSFGDVEMTRLLLEYGAWLDMNYQELLDIAAEAGSKELRDILEKYDIRNLHRPKRLEEGDGKSRRYDDQQRLSRLKGQSLTHVTRTKLMPALIELLRLKGQRGKWTGIKAVKVLRVAYAENVPEYVLRIMEQNLQNIRKVLMDLMQGGAEAKKLHDQGERLEYALAIDSSESSSDTKRTRSTQLSQSINKHPSLSSSERRAAVHGHEEGDEIHCLTCDGLGGRKGTGRPCTDCHGSGSIGRSPKLESAERRHIVMKCRACDGTGKIFPERDRCRACKIGSWRREILIAERDLEEGSNDRRLPVRDNEHMQESMDPPPPYPGR